MTTIELENLELTANPDDLDDAQFVSIWNLASATMGADLAQTRMLAAKILGFSCKHRCGLVSVSPSDAKYLDDLFERENSLLYDWKPESEKVDVLAQHACVPYDLFCRFLKNKKFKAEKNYAPRRADRVEWFTEDWNVG